MKNEKYYFNPEMEEAKTKKEWFTWFNENGNKDRDGWKDAETWFSDMLHDGLLVELENIIAIFTIGEKLVIIEKFDNDDYSIYFDSGSYTDSWEYIAEYIADNFNGANLNDYIKTANFN